MKTAAFSGEMDSVSVPEEHNTIDLELRGDLKGATILGALKREEVSSWSAARSFPAADFSKTVFCGSAKFDNRDFLNATRFDEALFLSSAEFFGANLHGAISFSQSNFTKALHPNKVHNFSIMMIAYDTWEGEPLGETSGRTDPECLQSNK